MDQMAASLPRMLSHRILLLRRKHHGHVHIYMRRCSPFPGLNKKGQRRTGDPAEVGGVSDYQPAMAPLSNCTYGKQCPHPTVTLDPQSHARYLFMHN